MGRRYQPFAKEVAAKDREEALEKVLSLMGSKHGTKRRDIKVKEVREISAEDVADPVVTYLLGLG